MLVVICDSTGPALIKSVLEKKKLGRIVWAGLWGGMHLPSWHPEEDYRTMYSALSHLGGGVVNDFIHELDLILWLFGKPKSVYSRTQKQIY